jgi:hypothetical protein
MEAGRKGGVRPKIRAATASAGESDGKVERLGFGGPPESENQLRLKKYVASHPKEFGAPKDCKKGLVEYRLPSADEMDVLFMSTREQVVVEVKSKRSNSVDFERGVFQCVKCRAVLQAQSDVSNPGSRVWQHRTGCRFGDRGVHHLSWEIGKWCGSRQHGRISCHVIVIAQGLSLVMSRLVNKRLARGRSRHAVFG